MHTTDDDERFMSQFDPKTCTETLILSRAGPAVVHAYSHVGLRHFASRVGPVHRGLNGRDVFSEVLDLGHENDIAAVAYQSLIHDTWAYRNNPDWRIVGVDTRSFC